MINIRGKRELPVLYMKPYSIIPGEGPKNPGALTMEARVLYAELALLDFTI